MRIVAVVNQKGGVGKTTVTINVAYAVAEAGHRVLVVDLDPQANATAATLPQLDETFDITTIATTNDVLDSGAKGIAADAILSSPWHDHLDVIPAEMALAHREQDTRLAFEQRLRNALDGLEGYDLVLVDCPPNVGRLTVNALVAADSALLVTQAARASVQGLVGVLETVELVHDNYNGRLAVAGIVVNQLERTREAAMRLAELDAEFGTLVWQPPIPKRAAVAEAYGACVPIEQMSSGSDAWGAIGQIGDLLLKTQER